MNKSSYVKIKRQEEIVKNNDVDSQSLTFMYAKVSGNKWSFQSSCISYLKLMVKKVGKSGKRPVSNDFCTWTDHMS